MKIAELKSKNIDELQEHKQSLLKEQFNLRMQKGTGQLNKPHLLSAVRKQIAQVKTLISEKQRQSGE